MLKQMYIFAICNNFLLLITNPTENTSVHKIQLCKLGRDQSWSHISRNILSCLVNVDMITYVLAWKMFMR